MNVHTPDRVPILALRNMVLFPGVVTPILIGRQTSKALVEKAEKKGLIIGVVAQRDPDVDYPDKHDLYEVGVYAKVMKAPHSTQWQYYRHSAGSGTFGA